MRAMRMMSIGAAVLQCLAVLGVTAAAGPVVGAERLPGRPRYKGFASGRQATRMSAAIIRGNYAKPKAFPYQVYVRVFLTNGTIDFCGGAIISYRHILTAAHCVNKSNVLHEFAVVGSVNRFSKHALVFTVVKQTFYKVSKGESVEADIAVLMVDRPIPVQQDNVKIVKMQVKRPAHTKIKCSVAGWGESQDSLDPNLLKAIKIPLIDQKRCRDSYPDDPPGDLLCAGYYAEGGIDTCQGDSGSPLVCDGKLTGLVKGGVGCGLPHFPGTYTDVSYYRAWINRVMRADLRMEYQREARARVARQRFGYRARRQFRLRPSRRRRLSE